VWIVDGVKGGRFGFISKVHHAMVDGVRSIDLVEAILTPDPMTEFEPAPPWKARPRPSAAMLALDDLGRAARVAIASRQLRLFQEASARQRPATCGQAGRPLLPDDANAVEDAFQPPDRLWRFDWSTALADVGAVQGALGGSVSDVVQALTGSSPEIPAVPRSRPEAWTSAPCCR
jgi:hypothetical protein